MARQECHNPTSSVQPEGYVLGEFRPRYLQPDINPSKNHFSTSDDYAFDSSGNTTADAEGRTFVYDAENKQVEVIESSVTIGEYFY